MGEAKRRRLVNERPAAQTINNETDGASVVSLKEALTRIDTEAGGVWSIDIIYFRDLPGMVSQALAGNKQVGQTIRALENATMDIQRLRTTLCLLCERDFARHKIGAYVLASAQVDEPLRAVCNLICSHCAANNNALPSRVHQYYKKYLFSNDARVIPTETISPTGTA